MNNCDKLQARASVCMSLSEIADCREALKTLTRQMAAEMSAKNLPRLRPPNMTFEAADAVTWLCVHCKQQNISPGVWASSPKNGFIARTTHFLRGNSFSRTSRSQSMDMSGLQISLPSPTAQFPLPSASPRTPISFFPKLKTPSPHNKRKSLPVRTPSQGEEPLSNSPSFFGKLTKSTSSASSDRSATPPPDSSPSFFAKLISPFARPSSITRMHSLPTAELFPSYSTTANTSSNPSPFSALDPLTIPTHTNTATITHTTNTTPITTSSPPVASSKPHRLPKTFDFTTNNNEKRIPSPTKDKETKTQQQQQQQQRSSFSIVHSTNTNNNNSTDISPTKRFGAVLAVPQSPRNSVSLSRKQSASATSFSSCSDTSRRSLSEEEHSMKKPTKRGSSEEKRQIDPLLLLRQISGKRGSKEGELTTTTSSNNNNNNFKKHVKHLSEGNEYNNYQQQQQQQQQQHRKKSSGDDSKKGFILLDEKGSNSNSSNENMPVKSSSRHGHKSSEDKSPRRTSDENVPDRNAAVKLWRAAMHMGLIQSVKGKKFGDNHTVFRFNVVALELEQSNSLTSTTMESSSARPSYSEITMSDPTPTAFDSIPSAEASPLDTSQSHLESMFSITPRGSTHISDLDVSVSTWGANGERDKDSEHMSMCSVIPPAGLFDYSDLKKHDFSWPLRADAYTPISRIGKGGFGDVFSAVCSTPLGARLVAVKVMDLEKVDHALPWLMQESKVMAQLSHPNLTQVFCSFVSETSVWLVMPLAHGGSCGQIMKANHIQGFSNLGIISYIMFNVVSGLQYLHSHGLLHRDIKADNILVSHEGHVLLADFGCAGVAREEKQEERELLTIPAGTRDFMSPEMVHGIGYDERTDIWSLGITAMELFMGSAPSSLREAEAMLDPPQPLDPSQARHSRSRSISSRSPSSRSSEHLFMLDGHYHYHRRATRKNRRDNMALFREFVDLCLSRNAASRPLARDLLSHPFLQHPDNGQEELVRLVKSVHPATALAPHEALPSFSGHLRVDNTPRTRRALSVPPTPRRSPTGRNLSLQHKKTSSKDDMDFIYVFR